MSVKAESGGMFNSYKVKYSPDTHKLLKVLMEEAKLTTAQRQQMKNCMRRGEPLPAVVGKPRRPSYVDENLFDLKRNYYFLRRGKDQIIHSGAYERERYRFLGETVDLEKEKNKLQNIMVYGKNPKKWTESRASGGNSKENLNSKMVSGEERVQDLVIEIEERLEFLNDMKEFGKSKEYDAIIKQEIAGKIREMRKLDRCLAETYKKKMEVYNKLK